MQGSFLSICWISLDRTNISDSFCQLNADRTNQTNLGVKSAPGRRTQPGDRTQLATTKALTTQCYYITSVTNIQPLLVDGSSPHLNTY